MSDILERLTNELLASTSHAPQIESFTRSMVEALPDAILVVDAYGLIIFCNTRAEILTEYHRDELIGKPIELLVPKELRDKHEAHRKDYSMHPEPRPMGLGLNLQLKDAGGNLIPVAITLSPMRISDERYTVAVVRRLRPVAEAGDGG